jgi:hypothetical protein
MTRDDNNNNNNKFYFTPKPNEFWIRDEAPNLAMLGEGYCTHHSLARDECGAMLE